MAVNLKGKSFLTLMDLTPQEIRYLLDLGHALKAKRRAHICEPALKGKHIVLLFEKTSTRTRCSFEVAATQEGAHVTYLDAGSSQMGKKESMEDSAKVLGRFFDGIEYRGYDQKVVEDLARFSGVPVWNGLGPKELVDGVDQNVMRQVDAVARETGATIEITNDEGTLTGADVIYGDIWASMGEEELIPKRAELLSPFRVRRSLPRSGRTRAWTSGRSPTRCSGAPTPWCSTRRRTGCTLSRRCWWQPSAADRLPLRKIFCARTKCASI